VQRQQERWQQKRIIPHSYHAIATATNVRLQKPQNATEQTKHEISGKHMKNPKKRISVKMRCTETTTNKECERQTAKKEMRQVKNLKKKKKYSE
jgi:hypothetical protein